MLMMMILIAESQQGPNEKRLLNQLFNVSGYNKLERPVQVEQNPLVVSFSIVIQQIIDVVRISYIRMTIPVSYTHLTLPTKRIV